jgi:hypothetical protein
VDVTENANDPKTLEQLLKEKNRKLETDYMQLKVKFVVSFYTNDAGRLPWLKMKQH